MAKKEETTALPKTQIVTDPPLADPGTTPELMTDEQREAFALKERARILALSGAVKLEEARMRNWISDADLAAMQAMERDQLLQPQAVLELPEGLPVTIEKRCC